MLHHTPSFSHCWKMGDVIYSLPAVKHMGGGHYYLSGNYLTSTSFVDFLLKQPYIFSCHSLNGQKVNYAFGKQGITGDLITTHFRVCKINPPHSINPWLVGDKSDKEYSIVVNVTDRWRGEKIDFSFMNDFNEVYFVGFKNEFHRINFKAKYIYTPNFNDFAKIINSCKVFVGSPSVAVALAVGFGKPVLIDEGIWGSLKFKLKNKFELSLNKKRNALILECILNGEIISNL
jgi:hypothetical protein